MRRAEGRTTRCSKIGPFYNDLNRICLVATFFLQLERAASCVFVLLGQDLRLHGFITREHGAFVTNDMMADGR
jgi:hypothetical protein